MMKHAICCSGISKLLLFMNYPLMLSWFMAATNASSTFKSYIKCTFCSFILLCAVEVEVTAVGCNTLKVSYTVNPLPGGGNEATLRSLVVKYRPILGAGSTGTRSVALNGTATEGVLCLSGLSHDTPYRVTYSVEVDIGFQTTLPSDLSEPVELYTGRNCDQQQQCQESSRVRTITTAPSTSSCISELPTTSSITASCNTNTALHAVVCHL